MNWRLGLLILLTVAIVVVIILFRKRVFEGFQTPTLSSRSIVEPSVFIVNPTYLTSRFPQIQFVQGVMNTSTIPPALNGLTGQLSKADAYTLCTRLGATMARIDDVRKETRKGTRWAENGWVDDLDKPTKITELVDQYEGILRADKRNNSAQQDVATAYAICIGPNPSSGSSLPNGWNVVPSTEAELPSLVKSDAADTPTTMTIFDPTAAYVQADIAQMEYPLMMAEIYRQDTCNPPPDGTVPTVINKVTQYFWWVQNYSDFSSSMYTWYSWIYRRRYRVLPKIEEGYRADYWSRIGKMSGSIAERFKSHPISFILKDYETIKTPEFIESVNSAEPVESTTANDRGEKFTNCDIKRPTGIIKTQKILFSSMPKGYPDPGFFCVPANTDLPIVENVFQANEEAYGSGRGIDANWDASKRSDVSCSWIDATGQ